MYYAIYYAELELKQPVQWEWVCFVILPAGVYLCTRNYNIKCPAWKFCVRITGLKLSHCTAVWASCWHRSFHCQGFQTLMPGIMKGGITEENVFSVSLLPHDKDC